MSSQSRRGLAQPISIGASSQRVIDARGFSKLVVYPTSGPATEWSVVHSLTSTAHVTTSSTSTGLAAPSTISVVGNFYLVEVTSTVGSLVVHQI